MESEELAELANDFASLVANPAWSKLAALLADQANHEEGQATRAVTAILRQGKPFASPEVLYRRMGMADGLREPAAIVDKVLTTWAAVQAQLEREERR